MRVAMPLLGAVALSVFHVAVGCFKLNDVFDCAALCDNRPHARTTCNGAGCDFVACDNGYADCNHDLKDGCEVNLKSDHDNCGHCRWQCAGAECNQGSCLSPEILVESTGVETAMAVDVDLFVARARSRSGADAGSAGDATEADAGDGAMVLEKVDLATRTRTTLTSGLDYVVTLATDQGSVYAVTRRRGSSSEVQEGVLRIGRTDGSAALLATTRVSSASLAVDSTNVYWGTSAGSGVGYVAKSGGPTMELPTPGVTDPAYTLLPVHDLAIAGQNLLLASPGGIATLPSAGGDLAILAKKGSAYDLAVVPEANAAYFLAPEPTTSVAVLYKVPLDGGQAAPVWRDASRESGFAGQQIAADTTSVYVALSDSILRIVPESGSEAVIAGAQPCITGVAIDADALYWCGCGGVRRVSKSLIPR
jgi:hypothetical protein